MIFDKELDESLWFILSAEEEKRKELIDFIKRIPEELLENIRNILAYENTEEAQEERDEDAYYTGSIVAEDGTLFSYIIEYQEEEKSIEITQQLSTPTEVNTPHINFTTELTLVKEFSLDPLELDDETWVGDFTHTMNLVGNINQNSPLIKSEFSPFLIIKQGYIEGQGQSKVIEYEYDLIKKETGYSVRKSTHPNGKSEDIDIDINQMPNSLTIDYLDKTFGKNHKARKLTPPKEN